MQVAVQSVVRELRSHMLLEKKKRGGRESKLHSIIYSKILFQERQIETKSISIIFICIHMKQVSLFIMVYPKRLRFKREGRKK